MNKHLSVFSMDVFSGAVCSTAVFARAVIVAAAVLTAAGPVLAAEAMDTTAGDTTADGLPPVSADAGPVSGAVEPVPEAPAVAGGDRSINETVIHGYFETILAVIDDFEQARERDFHASGELDVHMPLGDDLHARIDVDINPVDPLTGATFGSVEIEQIYGAWRMHDLARLRIGRFNNPMGYERQDAPRRTTVTRSHVYDILDGQTAAVYGNNLEGAAVDIDTGPAVLTLGLLNDIGGVAEENSILAHISGSPFDALDVALGFVTQEADHEYLSNINVAYRFRSPGIVMLGTPNTPWTVWFDYLSANSVLNRAFTLGSHAEVTRDVGFTLRYERVRYANRDRIESLTVAGNWHVMRDLELRAEWRYDEYTAPGIGDNDGDLFLLSTVLVF